MKKTLVFMILTVLTGVAGVGATDVPFSGRSAATPVVMR
jgi:hypothetical protein